jgi:hypothetical protein
MEQIDITTRFSREGKLIPLEFTLGEKKIGILNIGRQWETEDGKHILVMDARENTYHLFFALADLNWYLIRDQIGSPGRV